MPEHTWDAFPAIGTTNYYTAGYGVLTQWRANFIQLDTDIGALKDGSGFNAGAIPTVALADGSVTAEKIDAANAPGIGYAPIYRATGIVWEPVEGVVGGDTYQIKMENSGSPVGYLGDLLGAGLQIVGGNLAVDFTAGDSYTRAQVDGMQVSAGSGLSGGGVISSNPTLSHADTSSQASVNNSGEIAVQDISLDEFGHVTWIGSQALPVLPLAGGTMSAPINSVSPSIFNYDGASAMSYSSGKLYFGSIDFTDVRILSDDDVNIGFANSYVRFANYPDGHPTVHPIAAGANLGANTTAYRWNDIHCVALTESSDERLKKLFDIGDVSWLYELEPKRFTFNSDEKQAVKYGFSAQQVYSKIPDKNCTLVSKPEDEEKEEWGMHHTELIAPMLKLIQQQKETIDALTGRIEKLEKTGKRKKGTGKS